MQNGSVAACGVQLLLRRHKGRLAAGAGPMALWSMPVPAVSESRILGMQWESNKHCMHLPLQSVQATLHLYMGCFS